MRKMMMKNDKGTVNDDVININKGDKGSNEENERYIVDAQDDNKVVSNITFGNDDLMSDKAIINDDVINFNECNISNEK